jgi:hypothetical protein
MSNPASDEIVYLVLPEADPAYLHRAPRDLAPATVHELVRHPEVKIDDVKIQYCSLANLTLEFATDEEVGIAVYCNKPGYYSSKLFILNQYSRASDPIFGPLVLFGYDKETAQELSILDPRVAGLLPPEFRNLAKVFARQ